MQVRIRRYLWVFLCEYRHGEVCRRIQRVKWNHLSPICWAVFTLRLRRASVRVSTSRQSQGPPPKGTSLTDIQGESWRWLCRSTPPGTKTALWGTVGGGNWRVSPASSVITTAIDCATQTIFSLIFRVLAIYPWSTHLLPRLSSINLPSMNDDLRVVTFRSFGQVKILLTFCCVIFWNPYIW